MCRSGIENEMYARTAILGTSNKSCNQLRKRASKPFYIRLHSHKNILVIHLLLFLNSFLSPILSLIFRSDCRDTVVHGLEKTPSQTACRDQTASLCSFRLVAVPINCTLLKVKWARLRFCDCLYQEFPEIVSKYWNASTSQSLVKSKVLSNVWAAIYLRTRTVTMTTGGVIMLSYSIPRDA